MNARHTTLTTLLASLSLVITSGCAPETGAVDEEAAPEDGVQEIRGAVRDGVLIPREYVGPVDSCAAGWERVEASASCYELCPSGYHPVASPIGAQYCAINSYQGSLINLRYMYMRPSQALTCAPNLEYINGSCYRQCPAGTVSRGILGCATGG